MTDFAQALDQVRGGLRMYRAFQDLEGLFAAAVDAENVVRSITTQQATAQRTLDALHARIATETAAWQDAQAGLETRAKETTARWAAEVAAAEREATATLRRLTEQVTAAQTAHDETLTNLGAAQKAAEDELATTQAKLDEALRHFDRLKQRLGV